MQQNFSFISAKKDDFLTFRLQENYRHYHLFSTLIEMFLLQSVAVVLHSEKKKSLHEYIEKNKYTIYLNDKFDNKNVTYVN